MSETNGHKPKRQQRVIKLPVEVEAKQSLRPLPRSVRAQGKTGRPSMMTPEMIGKIEIAARGGASYSRIAQEVGVPPATLHLWMETFQGYYTESFREQIDMWRAIPCTIARTKLMEACADGSPWALKFLLENRDEDFGGRGSTNSPGNGIDDEEELESPGDPMFL